MKRLFISISKGEEVRFLGHLDFLRTMERAILRSGIPVGFSSGFNPHMKVSFDTALGVGVTADPLYMELYLEEEISLHELHERLSEQLPKGICLHHEEEVNRPFPKLPVFFTEDVYEMEGPTQGDYRLSTIQGQVEVFNDLPSFLYRRVTPKKVRELDVKPMISEPVCVNIEKDRAYLRFSLVRSSSGMIQPKDLWKLLAESFDMPWHPGDYICSRVGVYCKQGGCRRTLFEALNEREQNPT